MNTNRATLGMTYEQLGALIACRELYYRNYVLGKLDIQIHIVRAMVMLLEILKRRRLLGVSVVQMKKYGYFSMTGWTTKNMFDMFNRLVKRGLMQKLPSDAGVLWSLTPAGKAIVKSYCEWISGAHDGETGLSDGYKNTILAATG